MRSSKAISTHGYSYPWIIWVEKIRAKTLFLTVMAPKKRIFHKPSVKTAHVIGPVYYRDDNDRARLTQELIEAGHLVVPDGTHARIALSSEEVREITRDTWGIK